MQNTKDHLDQKDFHGIFKDLVATINENEGYLCEVDSFIGDGDHGVTLAKGFNTAAQDIEKNQPETLSSFFMSIASSIMRSIGGVCGPIYSSIFLSFAKVSKEKEKIVPSDLGAMLEEGLLSVKKRGDARVGDKTLVDAYEPAVAAFKEKMSSGFQEALQAAFEAAEKGMLSTKGFASKKGKSKPLGERSIGYQDAGATSFTLMLKSMRDSILKIMEEKG